MNNSTVFSFSAGGISGRVDRDAGVIRGAAVITGGVTARGHDLEVDDKTLEQIVTCGNAKGRVQVKLNHKDPQALQSICGYLEGFRREGNKVVADWHLLKSHEEFDKLMERAERMPDCFGLSAAFAGPAKGEKVSGGKKAARCEELLAVDCVAMPAANPAGLFEANLATVNYSDGRVVDTEMKENSMDKNQQNQQEPTIAEVLAALNQLNETVTQVANRQAEIDALIEANTPMTAEELQELASMSDEELAEQGITRAEVDEAIAAYNEAVAEGEGDEGESGEGDAQAQGEGAMAEAAGVGAAGEGASFNELRKRVVELEAKLGQSEEAAEQNEIMHAFDVLEAKMNTLAAQNEALQRTVRLQGIKAATPGNESFRMFSAQESDEQVTEFDRLVTAKTKEFEAGGKKATAAKAEAIRFVMKENPRAYAEHNAARGIVKLADA
jgi:uncharacterized protein YjiS (DUF1127 family)